ncbi:MAG TPA: hypothetical protein VNN74_11405 [Candidatus Micrarchaeia archaeon]|nr:hypothetical protein [Candidatus Micrarchaeia archaeon]
MTEVPVPAIERSLYPMPALVARSVRELARTQRWSEEGLDRATLAQIPDPSGAAVLVPLRRRRHQDILLVLGASGGAAESSRIRLTVAAETTDLEGLADRARAAGGHTAGGSLATPWNTLDLVTTDPDADTVGFTQRLTADRRDPAFARRLVAVRGGMASG